MTLKKTEEFVKSFGIAITIIVALTMQAVGEEKVGDNKVKIGILQLENIRNDTAIAINASMQLKTIINDIGFYDSYDQEQLAAALAKVNQKLPQHCRDPRCVLDIGKSLGMNRMIYGSIDVNDKRAGIKLTLIDITLRQTIGSVSILGDPGVESTEILKVAVAKLHGNQAGDTLHLSKYYGPEINNKKQFYLSSAGFVGLGLLWGIINYTAEGDANKLTAVYNDNEDLSGIPSSADQIPVFARPAALANAYTAASDDAYGGLYNPAGVAWVAGPDAAIAYQYRFGLNLFAASYVNKATREIGFGHTFLLCTDPDNIFQEIYFISSCAYKFHQLLPFLRPISAGVNLKLASNRVHGTGEGAVSGSSFGVGIDLGLILELSDQIRYGVTFRDVPVVNKWKNVSTGHDYFEANAATLHMGGTFKVGYSTFLIADGQIPFADDQPWKMAGGIEQEIFKVIFLRVGMQKEIETPTTTPWKVTGGLGLKILNVDFDASYEYNTMRMFDVVNISFKYRF